MKKYLVITFYCKDDAIRLNRYLIKQNILCHLIAAPRCVESVCAYVLSVENTSILKLKNALGTSQLSYNKVYSIEQNYSALKCQKIF